MHKLFSLYNQNRRKFWTIILAIFVIAFIIWRLINMFFSRTNTVPQVQNTTLKNENFNSITIENNRSAITGQNITATKNEIQVIDDFVSYCNNRKIEQAYDLLSSECKDKLYPKIDDFYKYYVKPVFNQEKKNVNIENWVDNIYKVDFNDDFLSTGKVTKENTKQDYITIVREGDNNKLNINKYVKTTNLNSTEIYNNLSLQIKSKDIYMDYETYTIEITNNSNQDIALCDTKYSDLIYLLDSNNVKHIANINELSQTEVVCGANRSKTIKIKFLNQYISTRRIINMVFSKVVLNYGTENEKYSQIGINL